MARTNGGIIGVSNNTSFGKCTVTTKTSSGDITTQPGTRVIESLVIAGGGSGGNDSGGGGGAGGMLSTSSTNVCGATAYAAVIGAGSANPGSPQSPGVKGIDSTLSGDYAAAFLELKPLAEQGNPKAQTLLGVIYEKGLGGT